MSASLSRVGQTAMRALCVLALLSVSFAHRPPTVDNNSPPLDEIALYTLPDGSIPAICFSAHDDTDHHKRGTLPVCDVCRLVSAAMLPDRADHFGRPILKWTELVQHAHVQHLDLTNLWSNTYPRGPPPIAII